MKTIVALLAFIAVPSGARAQHSPAQAACQSHIQAVDSVLETLRQPSADSFGYWHAHDPETLRTFAASLTVTERQQFQAAATQRRTLNHAIESLESVSTQLSRLNSRFSETQVESERDALQSTAAHLYRDTLSQLSLTARLEPSRAIYMPNVFDAEVSSFRGAIAALSQSLIPIFTPRAGVFATLGVADEYTYTQRGATFYRDADEINAFNNVFYAVGTGELKLCSTRGQQNPHFENNILRVAAPSACTTLNLLTAGATAGITDGWATRDLRGRGQNLSDVAYTERGTFFDFTRFDYFLPVTTAELVQTYMENQAPQLPCFAAWQCAHGGACH